MWTYLLMLASVTIAKPTLAEVILQEFCRQVRVI